MKRDSPDGVWSIRRWAVLSGVLASLLIGAAIVAGSMALVNLTDSRSRLLDVTGPQVLQSTALSTAMLNQETGVRGYILAGRAEFLEPYRDGLKAQDTAVAELRRLGAIPGTTIGDDLDQVLQAASTWRRTVIEPVLAGAPATGAQVEASKPLFDGVRGALNGLQSRLEAERLDARNDLSSAADVLRVMLVVIAVLLCAALALVFFLLHRKLISPIRQLAGEVRDVATADIHREVRGSGPKEMRELASDVESLRSRILAEVTHLERAQETIAVRTRELERSNSDLEQFAYVASHDLQEPLRKVASFCQLLQKRYQGKLDERGDQYIGFAVDGAKRMQALINDLLAFSRVGRRPGESVLLESESLLDAALGNLEDAITESGARITRGELPVVRGEKSLLTAVLQNLVGNAVKFRGEDPPEIDVAAELDGTDWRFSVTDNGIGISDEYAERIFVIFQRLHGRGDYPGTGIGLALSRKIVEHHGGRIWLDTTVTAGTRFCFTLPADQSPSEGNGQA
ncbi:ATP-binding protein [Amycolatopsis sp. BJA-103]|uniref:sensor histidine kinase n=1 Tax=Amycolatopsis sp. BJA-103 TaxID=1911175 RepID=UPI000C760B66|nr:sensor histidine kinase [Amycolatopsis sp. BJA-103]AUI59646.1 histidine kinase [Amycolatopsis sp. BJA-103]PNE16907.1 histidine kinase [Amycolatopsis sp. BJA-103]